MSNSRKKVIMILSEPLWISIRLQIDSVVLPKMVADSIPHSQETLNHLVKSNHLWVISVGSELFFIPKSGFISTSKSSRKPDFLIIFLNALFPSIFKGELLQQTIYC